MGAVLYVGRNGTLEEMMEITPSTIDQAQASGNSGKTETEQVTPQKAVQESDANERENVNVRAGIEALKQSVENDPVAQILNILV